MDSLASAPFFILTPKHTTPCRVSSDSTSIKILNCSPTTTDSGKDERNDKDQELGIFWDDVTGVSVQSGDGLGGSATITIIYYPRKKKSFMNKETRKKRTVVLKYSENEDQESNLKFVRELKKFILKAARDGKLTADGSAFSKPLLVLINPKSGPGKAEKIFTEKIEPMLLDSAIDFEVKITERAGQVTEMMRQLDINSVYGILCISGDGLVFEAYQGLMARPDWQQAVQLPVAPGPGGSGNALCCSINYYAGEAIAEGAHISTFVTLKHQILPMDLVAVDVGSKRFYSFLSVTWGMTADIDIESEKFRFLGAARFTYLAFKKIFGGKTYEGTVSFLPSGEYKPIELPRRSSRSSSKSSRSGSIIGQNHAAETRVLPDTDLSSSQHHDQVSGPPKPTDIEEQRHDESHANQGHDEPHANQGHDEPHANQGHDEPHANQGHDQPHANQGHDEPHANQGHDEPHANQGHDEPHANQGHDEPHANQGHDEPHANQGHDEPHANQGHDEPHANQGHDEPHANQGHDEPHANQRHDEPHASQRHDQPHANGKKPSGAGDNMGSNGYGPKTDLLPPLSEPTPVDWVQINGSFVTILAVTQSHISHDMMAGPEATLSDGCIHLVIMHAGASKLQIIKAMTAMETGDHVNRDYVQCIKVKAFRIEPKTPGGYMSVDGEQVDYGPIQGQILPSVARVMAKPKLDNTV